MAARRLTTETVLLCIVIVISALSLGAISAYAYAHRSDSVTIHHVDNNGQLSIDQARRTECRAIRSAALDKARFDIVFKLLSDQTTYPRPTPEQVAAAGKVGLNLPNIATLTDKGGQIEGQKFAPCPKSIAGRKTP